MIKKSIFFDFNSPPVFLCLDNWNVQKYIDSAER